MMMLHYFQLAHQFIDQLNGSTSKAVKDIIYLHVSVLLYDTEPVYDTQEEDKNDNSYKFERDIRLYHICSIL
jgi:hypothetical protein